MIPRYSRPDMVAVWAPETRFRIWFEIEAHALDAMAELGIVPKEAAAAVWERGAFEVERIDAIEAETRHDVIAFLTNVAEHVGDEARFLHQGMTSSDVLDTCLAVQLARASDILVADLDSLLEAIKRRAFEHKLTPTIGRSHGIHAEPVTFGMKLAQAYAEFERNRERLVAARADIATCAISGAVGTFANIDPAVEAHVADKMGLSIEPVSTQVIPRDRHAMFFATLGVLLAYMPTIALSNSVALNAISDTEKQFPAIRVFGTIGWIVAGLVVGIVLPGEAGQLLPGDAGNAERTAQPLYLAGAVSIAYGLYAFTLPKTPPRAEKGEASIGTLLGLDAIRTSDRSFWVLIICSTLMMIPFSFYNVYANPFLDDIGVTNPAATQTIGQVSEVGFLLMLPLFFRWIGIKGVLFVGMLAWAIRYVLFANGFDENGPIEPLIYLGLALHGVGFDFVFVAATIWVGKHFAAQASSRAQSFLALMTWGVGYLIGSNLANAVKGLSGTGGQPEWETFWLMPAGFAAVTALLFLILFRDRRGDPAPAAA